MVGAEWFRLNGVEFDGVAAHKSDTFPQQQQQQQNDDDGDDSGRDLFQCECIIRHSSACALHSTSKNGAEILIYDPHE